MQCFICLRTNSVWHESVTGRRFCEYCKDDERAPKPVAPRIISQENIRKAVQETLEIIKSIKEKKQ